LTFFLYAVSTEVKGIGLFAFQTGDRDDSVVAAFKVVVCDAENDLERQSGRFGLTKSSFVPVIPISFSVQQHNLEPDFMIIALKSFKRIINNNLQVELPGGSGGDESIRQNGKQPP
jgi:hypothetical protein